MTAFRVFSGWDSRQAEAAEVFAYSVRENASIPVDIQCVGFFDGWAGCRPPDSHFVHADQMKWPDYVLHPGSEFKPFSRQGATAFSYVRFLTPYFCDYEGVAAFFDGCDQLCLGDVAELAALDMGDCAVRVVKHRVEGQARPRVWSSVMLLDCAKLQWWTPAYVESAPDAALMRFQDLGDEMLGDLPPEWNALVGPADAGAWEYASTSDPERLGPLQPRSDLRLLHWSYLSDPNGGSWIDRSGSALWAGLRERWRAS